VFLSNQGKSNSMFFTLIIEKKKYWAPNQHFRLISKGSRDPEDWSNDAENRNKLNFKIYRKVIDVVSIFHNISFYFDNIYLELVRT